MSSLDWSWLSPSGWLADPTEPINHPVYVVLAGVLALALVAAIYIRIDPERVAGPRRFTQRLAQRWATWAVWLCLAGLTILLFRWQPVPLLSKPLWGLAWWLSLLAALAYLVYFYRRRYPAQLAALEESERIRRYLPRPPGTTSSGRRKPRRRR
jgi:hypothetical protein